MSWFLQTASEENLQLATALEYKVGEEKKISPRHGSGVTRIKAVLWIKVDP